MFFRSYRLFLMVAILLIATWAAFAADSFKELVASSDARRVTITIATPQVVTDNLIVPPTVTLAFIDAGCLVIDNGKTVTIQGPIQAPPIAIFSNALPGQGTVNFAHNVVLQEVYPEWWGASPNANAAVNTPALQAAINASIGPDRRYQHLLKFSGTYEIDDELKCYHMVGFRWEGQNKLRCGLTQTRENRRIIDGQSIAYGVFSNLSFDSVAKQGDGIALLDINYDGSQGSDLRPQNITFQDCCFGGGGKALIGVWLCRAGGGAQGDNIRFYNCYAHGFSFAAAVLGGNNEAPLTHSGYAFNAIYVQWIGGDIQGCPKYGLASYAGSWIVQHITLENQCPQDGHPTQSGADFYFETPQNLCVLEDIRSESVRFLQGNAVIRNCTTVSPAMPWYTGNWGGYTVSRRASVLNKLITGTDIGGDGKSYRITAAPTGAVLGGLPKTHATASAGPPATLTVTGAQWTPNEFVGYRASIFSAKHGEREYGIIAANTADTITLKDLGHGVFYTSKFMPHALYPDFQILPPSGEVDFVVEPDWGTQFSSTVNGITTTWEEFKFNTVDGAIGMGDFARFSGSIDGFNAYGKIRFDQASIHNVQVSQQDWAAGSIGPSGDLSNIGVLGGRVGEIPWTTPANGEPYTNPSTSVDQKGSQWIVWNRASYGGGPRYPSLGIGPGDDAFGSPPNKDILAFWGKLGRLTPNGENRSGSPLQLQGGLSTGTGSPGGIEFWFGKNGDPGTRVNGPATRQASLDARGLTLGPGDGSVPIGAAPSHGQALQMLSAEELVTVAPGASTSTTMLVPPFAVVLAISARVVEDIPGAATLRVSCGDHLFNTAPIKAISGNVNPGTAGVPWTNGAVALPIVLTPDHAPVDKKGQVRVTVHYYVVTPPAT